MLNNRRIRYVHGTEEQREYGGQRGDVGHERGVAQGQPGALLVAAHRARHHQSGGGGYTILTGMQEPGVRQ